MARNVPVRFVYRIKEGERKRPPPDHKAPRCGSFCFLQRCTERSVFRGICAHGRAGPYGCKTLRCFRAKCRQDIVGLGKDRYPAQKLRRIKQRKGRLPREDFVLPSAEASIAFVWTSAYAGAQTFAVCGALPHTLFFLNFLITLPCYPSYSLSFTVLCVAE